MTETEYQALRRIFVKGCMEERRDFVETMTARTLGEFIDRHEFNYADASKCESWKYMAKILWLKTEPYVFAVDGPATCVDPICGTCDGSGQIDHGGTYPWGEWIMMPCPECQEHKQQTATEARPGQHAKAQAIVDEYWATEAANEKAPPA